MTPDLKFVRKNAEINTNHTSSASTTINSGNIVGKSESLIKLKSLLDAGILTQEEFDSEKKKILNS